MRTSDTSRSGSRRRAARGATPTASRRRARARSGAFEHAPRRVRLTDLEVERERERDEAVAAGELLRHVDERRGGVERTHRLLVEIGHATWRGHDDLREPTSRREADANLGDPGLEAVDLAGR